MEQKLPSGLLRIFYTVLLISLISALTTIVAFSQTPASRIDEFHPELTGTEPVKHLDVAPVNPTRGDLSQPGLTSPGGRNLFPTVQFVTASATVTENSTSVLIPVSIVNPDGNRVSVDVAFQSESSSSVAGDFRGSLTRTVTFAADAADGATRNARFDLNDDLDYEGNEIARFRLTNIITSGGARIGAADSFDLVINDDDRPDVVINEILADPNDDIDGNGSRDDAFDDEFVEIHNNESREVEIGGWTFSDNGTEIRHTFTEGSVLPPSGSLLLFSRDDDGEPAGVYGGAVVIVSDAPLQLDNLGDTPVLRDENGSEIDIYGYGDEANDDQSIVRDPDGSGSFVKHSEAAGSGGSSSSPGTRIDGSNFTNSVTMEGEAGWRLLSAPLEGMPITDLINDTPIQGYNNHYPDSPKNFYVGYDGSAFVSAGDVDSDELAPGKGFLLYVFGKTRTIRADAPVTLHAVTGTEHTTDVAGVGLHTDGDGWNLLGNPFETAINISNIGSWTKGGTLHSTVGQIWDYNSKSYILTTTNNGRVAAWQGFFIENADAASIDFPVTAQTGEDRFYREVAQGGHLALTLKGSSSSKEVQTTDHAAVLFFHEEADHGWDSYDATKLLPLSSRYALLGFRSPAEGGDEPLLKAQDSRPFDFEGELTYDLELKVSQMSGDFELAWSKSNLPEDWRFTLIDNETGDLVDMNVNSTYTFRYSADEQQAEQPDLSELENALPRAVSAKPSDDRQPKFTIKAVGSSLKMQAGEMPESVKLNPNYPNPFNPHTTITYELSRQADVKLNVYTIVGQKVVTLVDGVREPGVHEEHWNASDMPSGIYIAQLEVDGKVYIRKMTLIK